MVSVPNSTAPPVCLILEHCVLVIELQLCWQRYPVFSCVICLFAPSFTCSQGRGGCKCWTFNLNRSLTDCLVVTLCRQWSQRHHMLGCPCRDSACSFLAQCLATLTQTLAITPQSKGLVGQGRKTAGGSSSMMTQAPTGLRTHK